MFFMPGVINVDDTEPSIRTIRKKRADGVSSAPLWAFCYNISQPLLRSKNRLTSEDIE